MFDLSAQTKAIHTSLKIYGEVIYMAIYNIDVDFDEKTPLVLPNEFNQFDFGVDILKFNFKSGTSAFDPTTSYSQCFLRIERADGKINEIQVYKNTSEFLNDSNLYYLDHLLDPFDTFAAGSLKFVISFGSVDDNGVIVSRLSSRKIIFNIIPSISSYNAVDKKSIDLFVLLFNAVKALQATVNYQEYIDKLNSAVQSRDGFDLSQNDFTNELKEKLEGIEEGAEKNVNSDWAETDSSKDLWKV